MAIAKAQKKKEIVEEEGFDTDAWMITFSDLLSLLLTFFVLMFSMSSLDNQVLKEMFTAFTGGAGALSFGDRYPVQPPGREAIVPPSSLSVKEFLDFLADVSTENKEITAINVEGLQDAIMHAKAVIRKKGPNFIVSFPDRTMFLAGSARLLPGARLPLDRIADALQFSESQIIIEGHTDDLPVSTARFPSNWELSAARAGAVMSYFINKKGFDSDRVIAALGYSDTRPVVRNISEGLRVRNRRVDIIIEQVRPEGV